MAESVRGAERQAGYGAKVIFKLAGDRAFDGPMAGIVDAGSHFVGEETAVIEDIPRKRRPDAAGPGARVEELAVVANQSP